MENNRNILIENVFFSNDTRMDTLVKNRLRKSWYSKRIWNGGKYEYYTTTYRLKTLGDIADLGKEELTKIYLLGNKAYEAIEKTLLEYGIEISPKLVRATKITKNGEEEIIGMEEKKQQNDLTNDGTNPEEITLDDLRLSGRSYNALSKYGITTLADIAKLKEEDLYKIRHIGARSVIEIEGVLKFYGLELGGSANANFSMSSLYEELVEKGFSALDKIDSVYFKKDSNSMTMINSVVLKYLDYLTNTKVNESSVEDYPKIEEEMEEIRKSYENYLKTRRAKMEDEEKKRDFLASMKRKNAEVRKYHHTAKKSEKKHLHNPNFFDDELEF